MNVEPANNMSAMERTNHFQMIFAQVVMLVAAYFGSIPFTLLGAAFLIEGRLTWIHWTLVVKK